MRAVVVNCAQRENFQGKEMLAGTVQLDIDLRSSLMTVMNVRQANTVPMENHVMTAPRGNTLI